MKSLIFFLIFLFSCNRFVQLTDSDYNEVININNQTSLPLYFSHNINGELYPCGCRKFPLGGLEQVAGELGLAQEKSPILYVDSGDTFFESTVIPDFIKKSSLFKAKKIAKALSKLGLQIYTPGDQDFAAGVDFLKTVASEESFEFLITNSSSELKLKHKKAIHKKAGNLDLYFLGVLDPSLLKSTDKKYFESVSNALQTELKKIKPTKNTRIILLSHSGLDTDKILAERFPQIDWIIGAHTQSFLRYTIDVKNTKIVQVLSRNHYMGRIDISLGDKKLDKYELVEIRDEKKDLIKPNPMQAWLAEFKTEQDKIYASEQNFSFGQGEISKKIKTANSCLECHESQHKFWQKTAHSMAFVTLVKAKEDKNPQCIGCHSVGLNQEGGFNSYKNIHQKEIDGKIMPVDYQAYWDDFKQETSKIKSVRELSSSERLKWHKSADKINKKHNVEYNYAHVQCLNCHEQSTEHPFGEPIEARKLDFKSKCMNCHTRDQSPSWYNKDSKGLATSLNDKYFAEKLKLVSCPHEP